MQETVKFWIIAVATAVIGSIYTFIDFKVLKNQLHLDFGLRHNDHVMIGVLALVICVVAVYKLVELYRGR